MRASKEEKINPYAPSLPLNAIIPRKLSVCLSAIIILLSVFINGSFPLVLFASIRYSHGNEGTTKTIFIERGIYLCVSYQK
jgi:hypothetical protein